jgi:hypothetical protein
MSNEDTNPSKGSRLPSYVPSWIRQIGVRRFPLLYFKKEIERSLAWHHKRDAAINLETTPTSDELIQLVHLWAVEFYTPSHAEHLASTFSALGWDKPSGHNDKLSVWLSESRASYGGGGWINLGFIHPPGTRHLSLGLDRTAPLPSSVEYATAHMFNLTSSITCIVVGFIFKREQSAAFDAILRRDYTTNVETVEGGFTYPDPRSQKQRNISKLREEIRAVARKWFNQYAPGLFSADVKGGDIPTCEFLTFKKAHPFSAETQGAQVDAYLDILDVRRDFDCWVAEELPGLKFGWPLTRSRDRFHSVLTINENDLTQYDLTAYGGSNPLAYVAFIDLEIKTFMTRWGCRQLLEILERRLNRIRDAQSFRSPRRDPIKLLRDLRTVVADSIDVAVIAPELTNFAKSDGMFEYEMPNFQSTHKNATRSPVHLTKALRVAITRISERLASTDRTVKDLLIQQGNLVGASENIKLQRRIRFLTIVLTLLTLVLAYEPLRLWINGLLK